MKNHLISRRSVLAGTAAAGALSLTGFPAARRGELEEIRRHQARGDPRQGPARRQSAKEHQGIHRSDRHPGRVRADPGAAAAPEGRDRARLRQAELRRHSPQLSRAEAAVREGRLARRHLRLHEGPEPHRARPRRKRFLGRRPAIRQERQGADAVAAMVGRLLHPLLQQGAVPEEGRRRSEDLRRDGRGRRKAHRRQGRHLRLRRARPAQRQHDAVDQLLPQLRRRIPRRQGRHPDRRSGGDRSHKTLPDAADQGRASRRRRLQLDGVDGVLHARPLGDVDRRRRLGAAAGRPGRLAHRRQGRLHRRAQGIRRDNIRRPMATASASRPRARTRKPPICCANGRSRRSKARGCCRPAAACRSATPSSTTPRSRRASRCRRNGCSR